MDDALKTGERELNNRMLRQCCSVVVCPPPIEISGYVPVMHGHLLHVSRVHAITSAK